MRLTKLILWMLLCGPLAFVAPSAHAQQAARVAGRIIAAKVQGTVVATSRVDQSQKTLASGDEIAEKYEVKTGADSSVILVFANGATANLGSDSVLVIEDFLMDPFAGDLSVSDMKEEPTSSKTTLNLTRGEMVGNVKHLREDRGSSFTVNTPVGAAGIRGTTFRIVFKPDANGQMTFTLSTSEGRVLLSGTSGSQVEVGGQQEVSVAVDVQVNATTGEVTITTPPVITSTTEISTTAATSIATAVQQIVETSAQVIITATATPPSQDKPKDPPVTEKKEEKQEEKKQEKQEKLEKTDLSQPTNDATRTTSGDGL
jgi:hypothetical protein